MKEDITPLQQKIKALEDANKLLFKKASKGDFEAQRMYSINLDKIRVTQARISGEFKNETPGAVVNQTNKNRYKTFV